jgi:hypothetical protein
MRLAQLDQVTNASTSGTISEPPAADYSADPTEPTLDPDPIRALLAWAQGPAKTGPFLAGCRVVADAKCPDYRRVLAPAEGVPAHTLVFCIPMAKTLNSIAMRACLPCKRVEAAMAAGTLTARPLVAFYPSARFPRQGTCHRQRVCRCRWRSTWHLRCVTRRRPGVRTKPRSPPRRAWRAFLTTGPPSSARG